MATSPRHRFRALAVTCAATAIAGLSFAPAQAAAPASKVIRPCANANAHPADARYKDVRNATLCLLNNERRRKGLRALRHNSKLAQAAKVHATDMVEKDYFAHDSPTGIDFVDRILEQDYVDKDEPGWLLGENLAWGSGGLATPRNIVKAWMKSPGHKANILQRRFKEIGISIVNGAPTQDQPRAATYATEFGARN